MKNAKNDDKSKEQQQKNTSVSPIGWTEKPGFVGLGNGSRRSIRIATA